MKQTLWFSLVAISLAMPPVASAETLEIEVYGMTCAFCVDSLERKLTDLPSVSKVEVSLKSKKVRLETLGETPNIEAIKQAILDAGFTPMNVTILTDEPSKE